MSWRSNRDLGIWERAFAVMKMMGVGCATFFQDLLGDGNGVPTSLYALVCFTSEPKLY